MRIGIIGGTGKLGSGLAVRWAGAGHAIVIGSRDAAKAAAHVAELTGQHPGHFEGADYAGAARASDVVVLAVPYAAHSDALHAIRDAAAGKIVVDTTVPLQPPKVARVHLPAGQAAALEAQALLGSGTPVVAALHHASAAHLADVSHRVETDVLVCSDDPQAKTKTMRLVSDLGMRALDAGALVNAIALESLTPVLIHLNRVYHSRGAGVVFTDLTLPAAPPASPRG